MKFKNHQNDEIEINKKNFKQILQGTILGTGLTQVELKDGTILWVKATDKQILNAAGVY